MASKRGQKRKACKRKVRHINQANAGYAAVLMRRKTGERIVPYKCQHCNGWHIGHPIGRFEEFKA